MNKDEAMKVLGQAVYGCYLLGVSAGGKNNGMPLSLFMQVGFDPPMVACGVSPKRRTHGMVKEAGKFSVIFLRSDQAELVTRFKLKGDDPGQKFEGLDWKPGENGAPLLDDCLGFIECDLAMELEPGDHALFVGTVTRATIVKAGELLTIQHLNKHYAG